MGEAISWRAMDREAWTVRTWDGFVYDIVGVDTCVVWILFESKV